MLLHSDADAWLYCFPLGGPAHCVQRWCSTLSSSSNVLAILNLPEVSSIEPVDSVAVYSFSKRLQSKFSQMQPTSSSSYSISSSDSTYADAGAQRQTHECQGHTVDVFNLQLFDSLCKIEKDSLWKMYEEANQFSPLQTGSGWLTRRAPTYSELEQLLTYLHTSTCVHSYVARMQHPIIPVTIRLSSSLNIPSVATGMVVQLPLPDVTSDGRRSRSQSPHKSSAAASATNRKSHSHSPVLSKKASKFKLTPYETYSAEIALILKRQTKVGREGTRTTTNRSTCQTKPLTQ